MRPKERDKRWFVLFAIGIVVTIAMLAGCSSDDKEPTPESAEQPPSGGAGGNDEQEEESGADVLALNVFFDPLPASVLNCKPLTVKVIVFNFDEGSAHANRVAGERGLETTEVWDFDFMNWQVEPFGSETGTGPQPDLSQEFDISGKSGELELSTTVRMVITQTTGDRKKETVAEGSDTTTIQVEKCPLKAALEYSGTFSDGVWTFTESATMGEVILEAEGDGPYKGSGQLTMVVSQTGNTGGGECDNIGAPMRGSSAVEITGDVDEDGEKLNLAFNFEPGEAAGGMMTCGAAGFAATVPMVGGPYNPSVWGIGTQDFPTNGGTQDVGVSTGLRGAPGSGVVGIEVEPLDVKEVAALD